MRARPDVPDLGPVGERMLEQAELELLPQDPADGVVDAAHRHPAGVHLGDQRGRKALILARLHEHVDSGVHGGADLGRPVAGEVVNALPVADHEAAEPEPALQKAGDQVPVGVHPDRVAHSVLGPVHARVGRHHAAHVVPAHRGHVRRERVAPEGPAARHRDALIDGEPGRVGAGAVVGVTVAGVVLRRREHAVAIRQVAGWSLEPVDRLPEPRHEPRVLAEALVGPSPAIVERHADAGRERPLRTACARLLRRHVRGLPRQLRVARGAQSDVVGKDGRAEHVAVAVHRVDPVDDRYAQARGQRGSLEAVDHVGPRPRRVGGRHGAAAGQHASDLPGRDRSRVVVDRAAFRLRHLPDLLLEGHARQEVGDPHADGKVGVLVRPARRARSARNRSRCDDQNRRGGRGEPRSTQSSYRHVFSVPVRDQG